MTIWNTFKNKLGLQNKTSEDKDFSQLAQNRKGLLVDVPYALKKDEIEAENKGKFPWLYNPDKGIRWDFDPIYLRRLTEGNHLVGMLVDAISKEVSKTPWNIVEAEDVETQKRAEDPFGRTVAKTSKQDEAEEIKQLLRNPNPDHDFTDFLKMSMWDLLEIGSMASFLDFPEKALKETDRGQVLRSTDYKPKQLRVAPPETMTKAYFHKNGLLDGFWQYDRRQAQHTQSKWIVTEPIYFDSDEIVWSDLNPKSNNRYGYPPTMMIRDTLELIDLTIKQEKTYFEKGSIPSGALVFEALDMEEVRSFKEMMEADVSGKPHKTLMAGGDGGSVEYNQFGYNYKELQFLERQKWYSKIIASAFRVPISIVGLKPEEINRACYTRDTEVLTENGFKNYWEVDDDEKIAVYDSNNHELKYEIPKGLVEYEVDEEIVNLENTRTSMKVTKDHKILYTPRHIRNDESQYRLEPFNEINPNDIRVRTAPNKRDKRVVKDKEIFKLDGVYSRTRKNCREDIEFDIDNWLEFLGYFISEGCLSHRGEKGSPLYQIKFKQADELGERIPELLEEMGIEHKTFDREEERKNWSDTTEIIFYDKRIWKYLRENCGSYSGDMGIPREFLELPNEKLKILLDALIAGDGRVETNTNSWYGTTSKDLADDVQEIAFKLGYGTRITVNEKDDPNHNTAYIVNILKDDGHVVLQKDSRQTFENYKGKVWCFSTSTGVFVTRNNGKIAIQGNTFQGERSNFESNTLGSYLQKLERIINSQLVNKFWGDEYRFEFEPGMSENQRTRISQRVNQEWNSGVINRNEARRQLGYDLLEDEMGEEFQEKPEVGDGMEELLGEKQYECECLDCGTIVETDKHCDEIECPDCGGEMRRAGRPGPGKTKKNNEPMRETEDWAEFSLQPGDVDEFAEEIQEPVEEVWNILLDDEEFLKLIGEHVDTEKSSFDIFSKVKELLASKKIVDKLSETIQEGSNERAQEALNNAVEETDLGIDEDLVSQRLADRDQNIAENYSKRMANEITDTVQEGWESGESIDKIKDKLKETQEDFTENQSRVIARDQLQQATGEARNEFAKEHSDKFVEEWITSEDDRVRPQGGPDDKGHRGMNGKWKRPSENFAVDYIDAGGIVEESYPGNSKWGINCRCDTLLKPIEEVDDKDHAGV